MTFAATDDWNSNDGTAALAVNDGGQVNSRSRLDVCQRGATGMSVPIAAIKGAADTASAQRGWPPQ